MMREKDLRVSSSWSFYAGYEETLAFQTSLLVWSKDL